MTRRKNGKRLARARSARTGESYTTALRHVRARVKEKAVADWWTNWPDIVITIQVDDGAHRLVWRAGRCELLDHDVVGLEERDLPVVLAGAGCLCLQLAEVLSGPASRSVPYLDLSVRLLLPADLSETTLDDGGPEGIDAAPILDTLARASTKRPHGLTGQQRELWDALIAPTLIKELPESLRRRAVRAHVAAALQRLDELTVIAREKLEGLAPA